MKTSFFSSTTGLTILSLLAVANTAFAVYHFIGTHFMPAALAAVSALAWIAMLGASLLQRK